MNHNELKIYLVEPNNKSGYATFLVYTESETNARHAASATINHVTPTSPNQPTNQIDPTYLFNSYCTEVKCTKLETTQSGIKINFRDKKYILPKDFAVSLTSEVDD